MTSDAIADAGKARSCGTERTTNALPPITLHRIGTIQSHHLAHEAHNISPKVNTKSGHGATPNNGIAGKRSPTASPISGYSSIAYTIIEAHTTARTLLRGPNSNPRPRPA